MATLSMPAAQMRLDNFISGPVRNMVRRYALGSRVKPGYGGRFFTDMDTRALAFNLFGFGIPSSYLCFRDWVPGLDRVLRVDLDYRPARNVAFSTETGGSASCVCQLCRSRRRTGFCRVRCFVRGAQTSWCGVL